MTKQKALEDLSTHGGTILDPKSLYKNIDFWKSWVGTDGIQEDCGHTYYYYCNKFAVIRDLQPIDGYTYDPTPIDGALQWYEDMYHAQKRITIDKAVLQECIKRHRRERYPEPVNAFNINYKGTLICINPWLLQDCLEYAKDYHIWINESYLKDHEFCKRDSYRGQVYVFSPDYHSVQAMICVISVQPKTAKKCLENADIVVTEDEYIPSSLWEPVVPKKQNKLF